jgi:uncharacterized membrane protein (DUF4010 family)
MSLAATALMLNVWRRAGDRSGAQGGTLALTNPFDLATVLKFGALLAVVMLLANALTQLYGAGGAYALAAASGIADVDAVTLSMAQLARTSLGPETAATAILVTVAVNSVAKGVLAWITGGRGVGQRLLLIAAAAIAAGWVGLQLASLWDPLAFLGRMLG